VNTADIGLSSRAASDFPGAALRKLSAVIAIALIEPEIPQNTGNIARLSVALGAELFLVGPLGFRIDDRSLRRAAMDYWRDARVREFADREEFFAETRERRLVGVDPKGAAPFNNFVFEEGDVLVFGKESTGLSEVPDPSVYIPMRPGCRSINLANAVAIVAYEAMKGSPALARPARLPAWGSTLSG
jgi:tRNA (cytidine/uridine-2'-O-)-methyltransferase